MAREGTRSGSAKRKSPRKGQQEEETEAAANSSKQDESSNPNDAESNNNNNSNNKQEAPHHPLARVTEGMNRRSLLTGLYGTRGERIRHVVATGALSMPQEVLDMMGTTEDEAKDGDNDSSDKDSQQNKKKRKTIPLPGLDSVVRPTTDKTLPKIFVTDIFHKQFVNANDPLLPPTLRTVAANRTVELIHNDQEGSGGPERIRGGGTGDEGQTSTGEGAAAVKSEENTASSAVPSTGSQTETNPPSNVTSTQQNQSATDGTQTATTITTAPVPSSTSSATAPVPASSASSENATKTPATAASNPNAVASSPPAPVPAPTPAPETTKAPAAAPPKPSPAARRSSALVPAEAATSKVIPLTAKPDPHWKQHIPPSNDENLTDPQGKARKPNWFNPTSISNLERTMLPEWFDESASHRTEDSYLKARATMIHISDQLGNRFVTSTLARRSLPGDVGSLHRLHSFLTQNLWMNEDGRNDSAPTPASLQHPPLFASTTWTEKRRGDLIEAVVEASQQQPAKKIKTEGDDAMDVDIVQQPQGDESNSFVPIDWEMVAEKVGASAIECEKEFLAMPMGEAALSTTAVSERPITPDTLASDQPPARAATAARTPKDEMAQEELLRSLVEGTSPAVITAVTEAALKATGRDLPAARRAARLGLVAGQAAKAAQAHEETVSRLLSEVIDQRMQKVEMRMALMDDLEVTSVSEHSGFVSDET
ncbi:SNF complex subunit SMARCC1 [Seminavis robusta]|uniref:SNF complex subunit SMARCC1 n=1 Tax=Seminavis robusta TaxID=568900 RepID=A0A9N8ENX9_9STRA|nr:SNF complex subunit SMARCC1 [Seminavis robusta]|eukprot:Sro1310_g261660.1 SNF complex subunit SMARCC1 (711) ;mRNA; r:18128-20476